MSRAHRYESGRSVAGVTTSETPDTGYLPAMLNPFEPGFFDDPYAQYALVRDQDPVHLSPLGIWALFRYADIYRVLRDPSLSVEERNLSERFRTDDEELQAILCVLCHDGIAQEPSAMSMPIGPVPTRG